MSQGNVSIFSVGVFIIVIRNNRLLLVKNKRGRFSLPGGGVNANLRDGGAVTENVREAVERELMEEAFVRARAKRIIGVFSFWKSPGIVILFEGDFCEELEFQINDETVERQWMPVDVFTPDFSLDIYPAQLGMIVQALRAFETGRFPVFGPPSLPQES